MVVHKAIGRQNRNFLKTKQVIYGLYYELLRSVNDLSGVYIIQHSLYHNISAISWRPGLVVEEAGVPEENHRPWASNW
jgi:hypothetical protein